MKALFLFLTLSIGVQVNAQQRNSADNPLDLIQCDNVKFDNNNNTVEFIGNVSFHSEVLEIDRANKIILDKLLNEIQVIGMEEFNFYGKVIVSNVDSNKNFVYKMGDLVAFIQ